METLDIKNQELKIGDKVAFTSYGCDNIRLGIVKRITPKQLYIEYGSSNSIGYKCRMEIRRAKNRVLKL